MNESCVETVNSDELAKGSEDFIEEVCQSGTEYFEEKSLRSGISPAKIAEAERQISSESDDSSESSNEDQQTTTERSRPLMRSASPRRSASPMRRIQIGRSGSRKSTALTIKNLSYFPVRERGSSNCEDDEGKNGEEELEHPPRKPDINVTRMSVQDAISLFESKQKDQSTDDKKKRVVGGTSLSSNKSVLRRWSSGMGDSLDCSDECVSEPTKQNNSISPEGDDGTVTQLESNTGNLPSIVDTAEAAGTISVSEKMMTPSIDYPPEFITPQDEFIDKEMTVADWNQQKEAELNQLLLKMTESKPGKYRGTKAGRNQVVDSSNEKRGGFYSQYKEKRNEKLQAENVGRCSAMEAQFRVLKETLEQSKTRIASKSGTVTKKSNSPLTSQNPRRNSSPPVFSTKDVPKAGSSKKSLPKSSPLPTARGSWSSGSLAKANKTQPTKTPPKFTSTNTAPNNRKPQLTSSPAPPSPKPERLLQPKVKQAKRNDTKSPIASKVEKTDNPTIKTRKGLQSKAPLTSQDDVVVPEKTRFHNRTTKKSSIVPLEGKQTPRKSAGNGSSVGSVGRKTKVSRSDESSKNSGNLIQTEEKDPAPETTELTTKVLEVDLAQQAHVDANLEISLDNNLNIGKTEISDESITPVDDGLNFSDEYQNTEIKPYENMEISATAWVEVEHEEASAAYSIDPSNDTISPVLAPPALSSPCGHHSLSQMLQADSSEPEIIEWGNAENPPALVYQKDAPKGFKRLLKFARKSKADNNMAGCPSPSIYSEGEDDTDDYKAVSRKNSDVSRKAVMTKGYAPQRTIVSDSIDNGNLSKRADHQGGDEVLAAQANSRNITSLGSNKLDSIALSAATSSKSSRSFFSFSTFRSGKSMESKPR